MSEVLLFQQDRRKNEKPMNAPVTDNRRHVSINSIDDKYVDDLLSHCEARRVDLESHLRDKEKKKLTIIVSSFAVLSLVITILFNISSSFAAEVDAASTVAYGIALLTFLSAIAFVNISIIKYVVSLKMDCLVALRQLNCNRQAIHTLIFAKLQRSFPRRTLDQMECQDDYDGTILDRDTWFWSIYGRHEKYPLNNVELRAVYESLNFNNTFSFRYIPKMPADIFAIYAIAIFTFILMVSPMPVFILFADAFFNLSTVWAACIGAISIIIAVKFLNFVKMIVSTALEKVIKVLEKDEIFKFKMACDSLAE